MGVNNSGPLKYCVLSTIRKPRRNKAVAEKDLPKTCKHMKVIGFNIQSGKLIAIPSLTSKRAATTSGNPFLRVTPPITPNTVINKIGFNTMDFSASSNNCALVTSGWFDISLAFPSSL